MSLPQNMLSAAQSHLLELSSSLQHLLGVTSHDLGVNLCRALILSPLGQVTSITPCACQCLSYLSCEWNQQLLGAFSVRAYDILRPLSMPCCPKGMGAKQIKTKCRGQVNPFFGIAIGNNLLNLVTKPWSHT